MISFADSTSSSPRRSLQRASRLRQAVQAELARRGDPLTWNRHFLPGYFRAALGTADFHALLARDLDGLHTRRASRYSYVAPRGGAKSTWVTLAYALRCALEVWERYTLILSDSKPQAVELLRHIKRELEENERLALCYPAAVGEGPEWREDRIRLNNGAVVEALGTGSKIRGRRNRAERPTLVIFDDIQSNEDVLSPTLRTRAWDWAMREVIPAGDEATNFLAVGSALHREAVSVRLGKLAGWSGRECPAVHQWPDRMDLWGEFERIATNLADEERAATARAYFEARRDEMERGALTYWPTRFDLATLMMRRAEIGHAAFESEYQGRPGTPEGAEFPAECFDWPGFWFDQWPADPVLKVIALDPSKGTSGGGSDYQAHVMVAAAVEDGNLVLYVDADMRREGVVEMCARTASLVRQFSADPPGRLVDVVICEENGTLGLIGPQLDAAALKAKVMIPYLLKNNTLNKGFRIRHDLSGPLSRRQLRFRRTVGCRLLVDQIRDWPAAAHDDGPDGLSSALGAVANYFTTGRFT